ncbi:tetratricopeptide repeat protein [Palleronia abyssalis]|uniref:Uncharacterized protein n=1 Tax=Palleronia abyssalis TaxID=1501240 RepID=A0A2R8BUV6_9RHOB|nr:tetratricopeptide repeat protein [Palleronia abyssalis]SPJ23954.1 hypothetical protein PAA8504_01775 [Palleronia abyssalis]
MARMTHNLKYVVATLLLSTGLGWAQGSDTRLDDLFAALKQAEGSDAEQIVGKIASEWSRSGSPAMDMLLERGREALAMGQTQVAIGHFSALVDHAPDFAEGYNARATAYFQSQQFGPALADIGRVLDLNPRHIGALTGLAVILSDLGEAQTALAAWREVERLYPASPQAAAAIPLLEREVDGSRL